MADPAHAPTYDRPARIDAFLADAGWGDAARAPLAGDASFRRYVRLSGPRGTAMLMDAPPPMEDVRPFARLARHLRDLGFSAPDILAEDASAGLLLIEDFGDDTITRILARGGDERALYARAIDVLAALHGLPPEEAIPPGLLPYDDEALLAEAFLLTDWYLPRVMGRPTAPETRRAYAKAWLSVFPVVHSQPRTIVLRDFHVDNLMVIPGREGIAACGLLDFQDALAGAGAYDVMSLLEDARRDIDPGLVSAMRERYSAAVPGIDSDSFDAAFAILAAQRHAKVIGIFTRLCVRDNKPDYLIHIPRLWRLLEHALGHPVLAPVADWFAAAVPTEAREIPPCPKPA